MAAEMCLLAISLNMYGKRKLKIIENGGKIMEPADIMRMTMTVEEAKVQIAQLPEDSRSKNLWDSFAFRLVHEKLTPEQAQAELILAWNGALTRFLSPGAIDCD